MKKNGFITGLLACTISMTSLAGTKSLIGTVGRVVVDTNGSTAMVYLDGPKDSDYASCNPMKRLRFLLENNIGHDATGQATFALLMTAQMNGKRVKVNAYTDCDTWESSQAFNYAVIYNE